MKAALLSALLVLWLRVGGAGGSPVCSAVDYADYYFDLCIADTLCQDSLDLHADERALFANVLYNRLMLPSHLTPDEVCQNENATLLFLGVITGFPFCQSNQVPDSELGCICRDDRLCLLSESSDFRISPFGIWVVLLLIVIVMTYAFFSVTRQSQDTRLDVQKKLREGR